MERLKAAKRAEAGIDFEDLHSSMERLKVASGTIKTAMIDTFTFQYGEIKRSRYGGADGVWGHLHSSMERLKVRTSSVGTVQEANLHSSMERLKADLCIPSVGRFSKFTFQYGEIKRCVCVLRP